MLRNGSIILYCLLWFWISFVSVIYYRITFNANASCIFQSCINLVDCFFSWFFGFFCCLTLPLPVPSPDEKMWREQYMLRRSKFKWSESFIGSVQVWGLQQVVTGHQLQALCSLISECSLLNFVSSKCPWISFLVSVHELHVRYFLASSTSFYVFNGKRRWPVFWLDERFTRRSLAQRNGERAIASPSQGGDEARLSNKQTFGSWACRSLRRSKLKP
jgi:hypothetical protein